MLDISEKHMANLKWSDMADKNISMKMEFWWNVTKESDCNVAKVKAIVRIEQIITKFVVSFVKIIVFFSSEKLMC